MITTRRNPFQLAGAWLKGGIHIHSRASDGARTPEEVLETYRRARFDFLAFGDHWAITLPADPAGEMILIAGAEYDADSESGPECYHFMAVGMESGHEGMLRAMRKDPLGMAKALAGLCRLLVVAHPYWSSLTSEQVGQFAGIAPALEVYNHGCEVDQGLGFSTYPWDQLLSRGQKWDALAVDDAHFRSQDYCGGWVMVRTRRRTPEAILSALKAGEFYSTCGPEIFEVRFVGRRGVEVATSPVKSILFRCNRSPGFNVQARPGRTIEQAAWEIPEPKGAQAVALVRIEVADTRGRRAWSNPFYFRP